MANPFDQFDPPPAAAALRGPTAAPENPFDRFDPPASAIPAASTDGSALPRGLRNNNPGNIVKTSTQWAGEVEGADPRFKTFATMEDGVRALQSNLLAYQDKYGLNTVAGIINRWAPPSENDSGAYVSAVSRYVGVDPTTPINLRDPATMQRMTDAIIRHENGSADRVSAGMNGTRSPQIEAAAAPVLTQAPQPSASPTPAAGAIDMGQRIRVPQIVPGGTVAGPLDAPGAMQAAIGAIRGSSPTNEQLMALYGMEPRRVVQQAVEPVKSGGVFSDIGHHLKIGLDVAAQDVRELVGRIPLIGPSIQGGLDYVDKLVSGKPSDELLKEDIKQQTQSLTPESQAAMQKKWWDDEKGQLGSAWGDWRSYAGGLFQSLPEEALMLFPSMRLAKGIYAAKVAAGMPVEAAAKAASRAALVSGSVSEGLLGGAQSSREVRDQIAVMGEDQLGKSEAYLSLRNQGMTHEQARDALANDASTQAFLTSGVATGIFGGMGDRVLAKAMLGQLPSKLTGRILLGAGSEGLLEELPQSALQQAAQNVALRKADPTIDPMAGVVNQALGGAAVGALQGGGMAGVFGRSYKGESAMTPPEPQAPGQVGGDGNQVRDLLSGSAPATGQAAPPASTPPVTPVAPTVPQQEIPNAAALAAQGDSGPGSLAAGGAGNPLDSAARTGGTGGLGPVAETPASGGTPVAPVGDAGQPDAALTVPSGGIAGLRRRMDREAELVAAQDAAGFARDRQGIQEQRDVNLGTGRTRSEFVDLKPMQQREARNRLRVLSDMMPGEPLRIVPHPSVAGALAIARAPASAPTVSALPDIAPATADRVIEAAALPTQQKQALALDEGNQRLQALARDAQQSVERRNGTASPAEAEILDTVSPAERLYDRIDEALAENDARIPYSGPTIELPVAQRSRARTPSEQGAMQEALKETAKRRARKAPPAAAPEVQPKPTMEKPDGQGQQALQEPGQARKDADETRKDADEAGQDEGVLSASAPASSQQEKPAVAAGAKLEALREVLRRKYESRVDAAAHEAASSPRNGKPEPSRAQISANNAPLGHPRIGGLDISIENPEGSVREDKHHTPPQWRTKMRAHYGYVRGVAARAPDKDHVDVFVKPGTPEDYAGSVFVVDQNHDNGRFDEPKVMIGWSSRDAAMMAYLRHYEKGWRKHVRGITRMEWAEFKAQLQDPEAFLQPHAKPVTKLQQPPVAPAVPEPQKPTKEEPQDAAQATQAKQAEPQAPQPEPQAGAVAPEPNPENRPATPVVETPIPDTAQALETGEAGVAPGRGAVAPDLAGRTVEQKVMVEDTGEIVTVRTSAAEAIADVDRRITAYRALLDCLG